MADTNIPGSFRDPSGFLFLRDGRLLRQINKSYRETYDHLMGSGLYDALVREGMLVAHSETAEVPFDSECASVVIQPETLAFISYPYEWCFSQLKDAALLTLRIQKRALESGMSLKDASAYNVQFTGSRSVFIDTLSFERFSPGRPWVAYRQFCRHFLAPLSLLSFSDERAGGLLKSHIDGIPLDLAVRLLPLSCRLRPGLFMHLYLHAAAQNRVGRLPGRKGGYSVGPYAMRGLIDSLESAVRALKPRSSGSAWSGYYENTSYSAAGLQHKQEIVSGFLDGIHPLNVWDLGANTGYFSRCAAGRGIPTVSFDNDPVVVEESYRQAAAAGDRFLLPLVMDITNPSPGLGWCGRERLSLRERGTAHTVFALALVHHLAITHNLSFAQIADFLRSIALFLVIEFVPQDDPQARGMLKDREDIFPGYTQERFEAAFGGAFTIHQRRTIKDSGRVLYLMQRR